MSPRTSIIIAVKGDNPYLRECLDHCGRLTDQDFEIIVLPDEACALNYPQTRILATGPVGPSYKRDLGVAEARGSILAFLDDDAYPAPGWLAAAVQVLNDPGVAAACGPAVTPPQDGLRQQASGLVYSSWMVGGPFVYRYLPRPAREVDDYPSCNLIIKKEPFVRAGGFNTCYWPGEDTVVCLKLTHDLKFRIVYDPGILVYHHRRALFGGHLRQVKSYAQHRGYFAKRFPQTSLRIGYFFPSLFLLGLALGWAPGLIWPAWWAAWLGGVALYLALAALAALSTGRGIRAGYVLAGIVSTQVYYGWNFIVGLLAKTLKEDQPGAAG